MFITFEGIDGSGKTTQARLLVERLKDEGHNFIFLREPGGTEISEKIRTILLDRNNTEMIAETELFLFSAARAQLVNEVIRPALESGRIVVCDRFVDSTSAYQGYGRGLDPEAVKRVNALAIADARPTLTFIIDIDVAEIERRKGSRRVAGDRMESGSAAFYERVRKGYLDIAKAEKDRCIVIGGMRPAREIHEEIWPLVSSKL